MDERAVIQWHPDVRAAWARGEPVVALESSVLAQGLPAPANREADRITRAAVRAAKAVPAVTAVTGGAARVGIDDDTLERFLAGGATKVSARDLGWAIATNADGATTVAGALAICAAAGVEVFATGGIGGVHRAAPGATTYDESADLIELSRTRAVVVCAGAKSILDLPATLERLETWGVTVIGYGTDEFPGFFTAHTGLRVPRRADTPEDVAGAFRAACDLGRPGATLVCQPPPPGAALDEALVRAAVDSAIAQAAEQGVSGAAVTPALLAAVEKATGGASLRTNLALLEQNASLAGRIAAALADVG